MAGARLDERFRAAADRVGLSRASARTPLVAFVIAAVLAAGGTTSFALANYSDRQFKAALTAADLDTNLGVLLRLGDDLVKLRPTPPTVSGEIAARSSVVNTDLQQLKRTGTDRLEVSLLALQVQDYLLTLRRESGFAAEGQQQVAELLAEQQALTYNGLSTRAARLVTHFRTSAELAARRSRTGLAALVGAVALVIGALLLWDGRQGRRRREQQQAELRLAREESLDRLGRIASGDADEDVLIEDTIADLHETLEADFGSFLELREDGQIILKAARGFDRPEIGSPLPAGAGSVARFCIESAAPLVSRDVQHDERFAPSVILTGNGVRATLAIGIRVQGRPIGVLAAHMATVHDFGPEDVTYLQSMATVLAGAIERRRTEADIRHRALHDPLTGLPNRVLLVDRLEQAIHRLARHPGTVAVLFIDIDRFKLVNDSMSHKVGDLLLVEVAARIQGCIRTTDTLARFGGDEFVLVCEDITESFPPEAIAERVAAAVRRPFLLDGHHLFVDLSIGIATALDAATTPDALLADADAAMYLAKERGRGRTEVYDSRLRSRAAGRLKIENELRVAIDTDQLRLVYQPIVDLATGAIDEVEALVRWHDAERGVVQPSEFICVAEETGLIVPMGRWVLHAACRQAAQWTTAGPNGTPLRVSVNLSARQMAQPDVVDLVRQALDETGIDAGVLTLEITESTIMDDTPTTVEHISRLRDLGVRLCVDDFGTGYSSLGYLKRLPITTLKVDRSFVDGLGHDPRDAELVAVVVNLARALGLRSVAEGVERADQLDALRRLGADAAQGFLFSRPVEADELEVLLQRRAASQQLVPPTRVPS